jgi:hypothetical protein
MEGFSFDALEPHVFLPGELVKILRISGEGETPIDTARTYRVQRIVNDEHEQPRWAAVEPLDGSTSVYTIPLGDLQFEASAPMITLPESGI